MLIDTGDGVPAYQSLLSSLLESENCTIGPVLITHWHHDHVGGINQIKKLCPEATFSKFYHSDDDGDFLPIWDGDEFAVEGGKVKAIHAPGHTTDHIAFFMDESGIMFTGDSVLGQGTAVFENLTTYLSSLKKQLEFNPKTIFPGHGPVVHDAKGKIEEYIRHRQQREDEIIKVFKDAGVDAQLAPMDIVKIIYAEYSQSLWLAAERGIGLHLEKLKVEGRAKKVDGGKWMLTIPQVVYE
jgi:endoribonuclease LACTB2